MDDFMEYIIAKKILENDPLAATGHDFANAIVETK